MRRIGYVVYNSAAEDDDFEDDYSIWTPPSPTLIFSVGSISGIDVSSGFHHNTSRAIVHVLTRQQSQYQNGNNEFCLERPQQNAPSCLYLLHSSPISLHLIRQRCKRSLSQVRTLRLSPVLEAKHKMPSHKSFPRNGLVVADDDVPTDDMGELVNFPSLNLRLSMLRGTVKLTS